jgi:hypothetical protein
MWQGGHFSVSTIILRTQMPGRVPFILSILSTDNPCLKRAPNLLGMPLEFSKMAPAIPHNTENGTDYCAEQQSHLVGNKDGHSFSIRQHSTDHPEPGNQMTPSMRPVQIGRVYSRTEAVRGWQTSGSGVVGVDDREFRFCFAFGSHVSVAKITFVS